VIDRQREFTLENKELRERLVMNKLQISELKAAKASVEEDLESLQEQLQYTQKTLANQTELIQMRFEKDKSTIKSLTDENQRVNQLLQQLQVENMTLQGKVASFSDQLTNLQSKFDTLTKEKEIVENGKSLLEERIEQLARERDQDAQEIRLLTRRVECANENLLSARKEMIFKDACIRSLQAQSKTFDNPHLATHSLDKLTIDGVHLEGNKKKKNLSPHSQEQFVQHKLLESLNAELAEVREALSAHQAHSAFLQSDV
jgi:chromosome segregation ATPase